LARRFWPVSSFSPSSVLDLLIINRPAESGGCGLETGAKSRTPNRMLFDKDIISAYKA
jgi:hypothetical protein